MDIKVVGIIDETTGTQTTNNWLHDYTWLDTYYIETKLTNKPHSTKKYW